MALKPVDPPEIQRDLKGAVAEVRENQDTGQWFLIAEYENEASARDARTKLGKANPDMLFTSRNGRVLGRYTG